MQERRAQSAPDVAPDVARTWRTQRISFEIAGLGRFSVTADPRSASPQDTGVDSGVPVPPEPGRGIGADVTGVIANERARDAVELPGEVIVIPALGPVIPTETPVVPTVEEREDGSILAIDAPDLPDPSDVAVPDPEEPVPSPVHRDDRKWLRSQQVLDRVWREGVVTGSGALIGEDRTWFEPAVAVMRASDATRGRAPGTEIDLLELGLEVARDRGQVAVVHVHEGVLDVIPTGLDPRVPHLRDQPARTSVWPGMCPLTGIDEFSPCRAEGGPDGDEDIRARLAFDARRSLAVGLLGCGVCHGRGRSDDGHGRPVDVPLPLALSLAQIPRITLRTGETIEIDALEDLYGAGEPF
jgi:hypothetical protein